ncbi:hypothetical protein HP1_122 [Candidatus Termititenax spirochaetophilus]|uniref:Radical SAM core domain-containing protein n=1 Tax=Candidatus Termititenax spirochaetophilus TaxID=2218522 RepID=A0A388T703_9BACT|nr:hypothetical protein HP1_122 [Candidatus Termititenax spirochaetophilus]
MLNIREIEVRSLISKSKLPVADYVINPYIGCPHKCIYCYAEFMKRFTHHAEPWGEFADVKRCAKKINPAKYLDTDVSIGSVTDGYNPLEKRFGATREILKQFAGSKVRLQILTKSALIVRDIDLFKQIPNIRIGISLNTLDDNIRKKTEPYASNISQRLAAIKTVKEAGLDTWIFLSPMFPGITDFKEILTHCRSYAASFAFENLNLRGAYRPRVLRYIKDYHADLLPLYKDIYASQSAQYLYWDAVEQEIHKFCRKNKFKYISYFYHEKIRKK